MPHVLKMINRSLTELVCVICGSHVELFQEGRNEEFRKKSILVS